MEQEGVSEALAELAHAVASEPSVEELLGAATTRAARLLKSSGAVAVVEADGLLTPLAAGPDEVARAAFEGPVVTAAQRSLASSAAVKATLDGSGPAGWRSALAAPVAAPAAAPLGALVVGDVDERGWSDAEIERLVLLARVTASHTRTIRTMHHRRELGSQLQHALDHRVEIEQAKGFLMCRHGIDATSAFERIRQEARRRAITARQVASEVLASRSDL